MKTNNMTMMAKMAAMAAMMALGLSACSEQNETVHPSVTEAPVVRTRLAAYDGVGEALEGENDVRDLRGVLFVGGELKKIYEAPTSVGGGYGIQLDRHEGTLYVVANTAGLIDLNTLQERAISESDWQKLTIGMEASAPARFFSGSVRLDGMENTQTELPVTLRRGVARFDLQIRTAGVTKVRSIKLKNVAQSAYLFPVEGELSPADVERSEVSAVITDPLTQDTPAVLYLYEQQNDGLTVEVEAEIDGQVKTLTKSLSTDIERNKIYTLTVRKDVIDVRLDVSFDEWEEGGDTELTPLRR